MALQADACSRAQDHGGLRANGGRVRQVGRVGQVRAGGAGAGHVAQPARPAPQSSWNRDEWDVSLSDGGVYRIFQDRDTDRWFIDAIVD